MSIIVPFTTPILPPIAEEATALIRGQILDDNGIGIPAASLTAFSLTLYEKITHAIVNSRDGVDIKNANGGTVDSDGNFTMTLDPADNVLLGVADYEDHVALFEWTYNADAAAGRALVDFRVHNLVYVS